MNNYDLIRIIVADECTDFIEALKVIFSSSNYEITDFCSDGAEVLRSEKLYQANVVLLEIKLPLLNGLDIAHRIHVLFPEIIIIALTMHAEKVVINEILSAGFDACVFKPKVVNLLTKTIDQLLNKKGLKSK